MSVIRQFAVILGASLLLAMGGASIAKAGVTCTEIPSWCPSPGNNNSGGGQSTPAPGVFGLLALGAGASIIRMRRRSNKD